MSPALKVFSYQKGAVFFKENTSQKVIHFHTTYNFSHIATHIYNHMPHILMPLGGIILHLTSRISVPMHRGEKYQLFELVYLRRLLDLSYFNAKPLPTQ